MRDLICGFVAGCAVLAVLALTHGLSIIAFYGACPLVGLGQECATYTPALGYALLMMVVLAALVAAWCGLVSFLLWKWTYERCQILCMRYQRARNPIPPKPPLPSQLPKKVVVARRVPRKTR
jgi:hypothetical protein